VTPPSGSSAAAAAADPVATTAEPLSGPPRGGIVGRLAAAFSYRDFRILWFGACTSSIGTWMQEVAQNWLVLDLTNSAKYLALDAFLGELPILLFTLIGGVVADRQDRRKVLLASQVIQMTSAFTLAGLVLFGYVRVWHVLVLSFVTGFAQAFGGPAYQSLIPSLVRKEHLPNAIALNSIQFNIARVIGPLLAAAALHAFGSVSCFGLNGLSFLVVIAALLSLKQLAPPPAAKRRMRDELGTGLKHVWNDEALAKLTILAFSSTFLGVPLLTFLPVFTKYIFHGDVGQYSKMMACSGVGAIAGALVVAWLGRFRHMGVTAMLLQTLAGGLIVAFTVTRAIWLSYVLLLVTGAAIMITFSLYTSLTQLIAPNELRGRVMSVYMVAFRGGMPLGSLLTGFVVDQAGAPLAIGANGALLSAVAIWFLLHHRSFADSHTA
jgi:MFS family permease